MEEALKGTNIDQRSAEMGPFGLSRERGGFLNRESDAFYHKDAESPWDSLNKLTTLPILLPFRRGCRVHHDGGMDEGVQ